MTNPHPIRSLLLLILALPVQAAETYVPWPGKDELRSIQLEAFQCSKDNQSEPCNSTRSRADALMDHPRLPGVCKDVLWTLVETATVSPSNDYKRRDAIDNAAKRLSTICAEPVKKKAEPKPGAPQQKKGGFGFGA